jgi:hypothetical protein
MKKKTSLLNLGSDVLSDIVFLLFLHGVKVQGYNDIFECAHTFLVSYEGEDRTKDIVQKLYLLSAIHCVHDNIQRRGICRSERIEGIGKGQE